MKDLILTASGLRLADKTLPCVIGRNGITTFKHEGDRKTPSGKHQIVGMLFRPDRIKRPRSWAIPIRPRDIWSDDIKDPDYNLMGTTPTLFRHENFLGQITYMI